MTENSLVLNLKGQVRSGKQALKALHSHCSWPQLDPISLSQICWEGYSLIHVLHVTSFLVIALRLASPSLPPSLLPAPPRELPFLSSEPKPSTLPKQPLR